ncbi:filament-like plant protein 7 [Canna indica]|uniref:Filament-like plant protein 7 n=1 Tax=Canna indica TaxID=4628 RepID=A0AAQ3QCY0_9LILI|nr:filament-like plant protein 7 [Canna indica]
MENNTWVWKRNPSHKNIKKKKTLELERSLEELNERLSSVLIESNGKDDLLAKQEKVAEEAIAGWKKAEAEACSLKWQLDVALLQKRAAEDRVVDAEKSLKECMQQLQAIKEDQKLIINNAALKISREQESARALEQNLVETNKRLTELIIRNDNLNKNLEAKEHLLKELSESKSKSEANFMEVKAKLESTEKLNASLKYELCRLQKELQIWKEEQEINRKSADSAHRQHLESIKKIAKLETKCQRLRVIVRQRLPGPAALAKIRSEVEMMENNAIEKRKKKSNSTSEASHIKDIGLQDSASLVAKMNAVEQKNEILKQSLTQKDSELQESRVMFAHTASKLSQVESQLEEFTKGQSCFNLAKKSPVSQDHSLSSISDNCGNEDHISCAESWASALISELEYFKSGKSAAALSKSAGITELSLMDDFVEMEKQAVVPLEKHFESSLSAFDNSNDLSEATGKELVPRQHKQTLSDTFDGAISMDTQNSINNAQLCLLNLEKPVRKLVELVKGVIHRNLISKNNQHATSGDDDCSYLRHKSSSGYYHVACAFLWGSSELTAVLQNFVAVCDDLLHEKIDLQKFTAEVTSTLDWVVSHCFSPQDVLEMKEITVSKNLEEDAHEEPIATEQWQTPAISAFSGLYILSGNEGTDSKLKSENEHLKYEILSIESRKNDLEEKLKKICAKNETSITRLRESEEISCNSEIELAISKNGRNADQIINQRIANKDLRTHLAVRNGQKLSLLEVELGHNSDCCEELKETCLEEKLHSESALSKEAPKCLVHQEEKQIGQECHTVAASEELAACQETILNLRKQIKALTSPTPRSAHSMDKLKSCPAALQSHVRTQLIDHFQLDDKKKSEEHKSRKPNDIICTDNPNPTAPASSVLLYGHKMQISHGQKSLGNVITQLSSRKSPGRLSGLNDSTRMLVVLPKRQKGVSSLRKLLLQRKHEGNRKLSLPMKA